MKFPALVAGLMLAQTAAFAAPAFVQPSGPAPAAAHTNAGSNLSGWAHVAANGTLIQGVNATGAIKLGTGAYEVDFNSKLNKCAFTATPFLAGTTIGAEPRAQNIRAVFVNIMNSNGSVVDGQFYLVVTC